MIDDRRSNGLGNFHQITEWNALSCLRSHIELIDVVWIGTELSISLYINSISTTKGIEIIYILRT